MEWAYKTMLYNKSDGDTFAWEVAMVASRSLYKGVGG